MTRIYLATRVFRGQRESVEARCTYGFSEKHDIRFYIALASRTSGYPLLLNSVHHRFVVIFGTAFNAMVCCETAMCFNQFGFGNASATL